MLLWKGPPSLSSLSILHRCRCSYRTPLSALTVDVDQESMVGAFSPCISPFYSILQSKGEGERVERLKKKTSS